MPGFFTKQIIKILYNVVGVGRLILIVYVSLYETCTQLYFSYVRERWGTSCGFDLGRFHSSNSSYLSATLSLNTVFVVFTIYCIFQAFRNSKRGHNEFEPLLNDVELVKVSKRKMSLVVRKPVFGVSDQVRHKPSCTATEDGLRFEISD